MKKTEYGWDYQDEYNRVLRRRRLCRLAADLGLIGGGIMLAGIVCLLAGTATPRVLIGFLVSSAVTLLAFCAHEHFSK